MERSPLDKNKSPQEIADDIANALALYAAKAAHDTLSPADKKKIAELHRQQEALRAKNK